MKKLMIAMGAAAMMSLCANAVPTGGTSLETGTKFNSYEGKWDPTKDDAGGGDGPFYWTGGGGDSSSSIEGDSDKYLKIEETEALTRTIKGLTGGSQAVGESGVYFSSKVQFTAADVVPDVTVGVDKIIVWAKAPAEDAPAGTTTNLMVTAWDADGVVTNIDTELTVVADAWYNLEIIASPSTGENPISPISFMVKLGDNQAVGPFFSMVGEGGAAGTISSASFKGTGAVDDIDWGTMAAAPDVTVTVTCTDGYTVYTSEAATPEVEYSAPIVVKAGASVTVYVGDDDGTLNVTSSVGTVGEYDVDNAVWPVTYTTDAQTLAVTLAITVEPDDGKTAITASDVTLSYTQATYDEGIDYPTVTVTVSNVVLTAGIDYTVSWVPDTITAAGGEFTVTVAGTGNYKGSVVKTITITPAGGDEPEIVVPDGGSVETVIAGATSGTGIPLANVTSADQVVINNSAHTIKVGSADAVSIAPFYTATLAQDMKSITLTLNDAALTTAGNLVEVSVDTTFGLSVSASNTKLYYGLSSSATVNGAYAVPTTLTKGTGNALTLSAAKGGTQCFYKLYVTDIAPAQN